MIKVGDTIWVLNLTKSRYTAYSTKVLECKLEVDAPERDTKQYLIETSKEYIWVTYVRNRLTQHPEDTHRIYLSKRSLMQYVAKMLHKWCELERLICKL